MNSAAPGAIDTPMLRGALEQFGYTAKDYAPQLSHLNRFGRAEEIDLKVSKNLLFKI
jgi:NAD(P)-dependent dehydrogenase (short-subunit alcohol dehydrogenase family)